MAKLKLWQWFPIFIATVVIVKLWVTSGISILPLYLPDDASGFVEHAKSIALGHWFGPYGPQTLVKQPFFPIYLALVHATGIPLTVAHILLDAFTAFIACLAVRPIVLSRKALALIFT